MPDNVVVDNGALEDFTVSADLAPSGLVQRIKLATSGDGEDTLVAADVTNGLAVNVTRVRPGQGSTDLGKSEDAPAASGDTGVAVLAVRRDTASAAVSADGDYACLSVDPSGNLRVAVTGGGGGGAQFAEDAPHTSGDLGTMALAVRNDTKTSMVSANGDYGSLQLTATGALYVEGAAPLAAPSEYTVDDAMPTNTTGPHVQTRKTTTPAATAPVDGDAQGLRSSAVGALWTAVDQANSPYGALTVKRALVNVATGTTDASVVAAVTSKKIRVLAARLSVGATASTVTLRTKPAGASTTSLTPDMAYAANGGEVWPFNPGGWVETNSGEGLALTTPAGGSTVAVLVDYVEV